MRKMKLFVLLLAVTLMLASAFAISSSAEEAVLKIDSANVAYNDMMHLVFTLKNTELVPDGAEAGIIVWDKAQEEYTVDNATFATFTARTDGSTTYYRSYGIAAPEIGTEIRIAACYITDDVITITQEPISYSLVEYFANGLNKDSKPYQVELYESVLTYGAASDKVLSDDNAFVLVRANGGYVGSYNRAVGAAKNIGESFTLRAPVADINGNYFTKWVDSTGATVSTDRVCTVTPEAAGISAYTAVFGGDAGYKSGFSFDDFETGELAFPTPDLTTLPTTTCYNSYSGTNMVRWSTKYTGPNFSIQFYALPEATKNDTTDKTQLYTFTTDESGKYKVGMKDSAIITEKAGGNKEMTYVRGVDKAAGYDSTYWSTVTGCDTAEIDVGYDTQLTGNGVQNHVDIYVYDGSKGATYRFNIFAQYASSSAYIYGEQTTSGSRDENQVKNNGLISKFSVKPGERTTISVKLNTSGNAPCFDFYYDGAYAGSLACSILKGHNASIDFTKAYVYTLGVKAVSSAYSTIAFDNISFK